MPSYRVAVVDDDDLSRRGMTELLRDRSDIDVVASLTHVQALSHPRWDQVEMAIVDAADERQAADQFPGVEVVRRIRERGGEQTKVLIITGHFFDDAVRRRMREAGADFFYNRVDLQDATALYRAVLEYDQLSSGVPEERDPETLFRLGVTPDTRVNEGVRFAAQQKNHSEETPGPIRRTRARLRYRLAFRKAARLNPVNSDGRSPDRDQQAPSLPQIERFLEWATKTKDRRLR